MVELIDISGDKGVVKEILVEGEGTETPLKVIAIYLPQIIQYLTI